jgi:hypothetical protein
MRNSRCKRGWEFAAERLGICPPNPTIIFQCRYQNTTTAIGRLNPDRADDLVSAGDLERFIEVTICTFVMFYKRNQLEEAIARTLQVKDARMGDLKLRMKRLLVTDRHLGRGGQSAADRRYAFFSRKPLGSGVEVMFTGYEAFALMAAIILLGHGIPQAKVVSILRDVRTDLEAAHREILEKDREELFDPQKIQDMARLAVFAIDNTSPVFLAFVKLDIGRGRVHATISVCRGLEELGKFLKHYTVSGCGATHFEFVSLMCTLADNLSKTHPVKRGRSTL